jgi:hypothetical protein
MAKSTAKHYVRHDWRMSGRAIVNGKVALEAAEVVLHMDPCTITVKLSGRQQGALIEVQEDHILRYNIPVNHIATIVLVELTNVQLDVDAHASNTSVFLTAEVVSFEPVIL